MGITEITAGVGAVLGLLGTVLGLLSTWAGLNRDRPRLKVYPVWFARRDRLSRYSARRIDAIERFPEGQFGVEFVNYGFVSVRVREVGICPLRTAFFQRFREFPEPGGRGAVFQDADGQVVMPYELLPGARCGIAFPKAALWSEAFLRARSVYVLTETDRLFVGRGKIIAAAQSKAVRDAAVLP